MRPVWAILPLLLGGAAFFLFTDGGGKRAPDGGEAHIGDGVAVSAAGTKWTRGNTEEDKLLNLAAAGELLKSQTREGLAKQSVSPSPKDVRKRPDSYFGRVLHFRCTVGTISLLPSGDPTSAALAPGRGCSEIHLTPAKSGCQLILYTAGRTGGIREGDEYDIYGYPVGLSEGRNLIGGEISELLLAGML